MRPTLSIFRTCHHTAPNKYGITIWKYKAQNKMKHQGNHQLHIRHLVPLMYMDKC